MRTSFPGYARSNISVPSAGNGAKVRILTLPILSVVFISSHLALHPSTSALTQELALSHSTLRINPNQGDDDTEDSDMQDTPASLRVGAVLYKSPRPEEYIARINNIHSFFEANRHVRCMILHARPSSNLLRAVFNDSHLVTPHGAQSPLSHRRKGANFHGLNHR